jgi:hypothetical protein
MDERVYHSFDLLLLVPLCPPEGRLCEGGRWKIFWQSWLQVICATEVLCTLKACTAVDSSVTVLSTTRSTATK